MRSTRVWLGIALLGVSMHLISACKRAAIITPKPVATVLGDPALPVVSASPILHLKSNVGVSQSGGVLTSWADQSGNGNNAAPVNGPTYVTGVLNGYPVLRFNGTNQSLLVTSLTYGPFTVFMVGKQTNANSTPFEHNGGGSDFDYTYTGINASIGVNRAAEGDRAFAATWQSASVRTITATCDGTFANTDIRLNGVSQVGAGNLPVYSSFNSNQGTGTVAGAFRIYDDVTHVSPVNGDLAEVIVYASALSTADMQSIEAYLKSKYAHY